MQHGLFDGCCHVLGARYGERLGDLGDNGGDDGVRGAGDEALSLSGVYSVEQVAETLSIDSLLDAGNEDDDDGSSIVRVCVRRSSCE